MSEYLYWSGVVINICVAIMAAMKIWDWFVWPAVESASMIRWFIAMEKSFPGKVNLCPWWKAFPPTFEPFGRDWDSRRCRYGEWRGVANWRVFSHEEEV